MELLQCFIFLFSLYYGACDGHGDYEYIHPDTLKITKADSLGRPCKVTDVHCLSLYLGGSGFCDPTINTDTLYLYVPHANMTLVRRNPEIFGFNNYKIKDFYINNRTRKLVLAVEFPTITVYVEKMKFMFHLKEKEPVNTCDYALISYRDISLTLTACVRKNKLLDEHVFTYINDVNPPMNLGPKLKPRDKEALKNFNLLLEDKTTTFKEMFVSQGPDFMFRFLRTVICKHKAN